MPAVRLPIDACSLEERLKKAKPERKIGVLLLTLLKLYSYVVIIRVVFSWMNPNPSNPLVRFVYVVTEPVLAPVRRVLPPMGGFDFSPIVVFIAIAILIRILNGMLF